MGKLIVFEGTDGSGKSTQFSLLTERLRREGTDFRTIVFPQYSEPSSSLIRMYLGGEFGTSPSDVNAYAASSFYAVDRVASYINSWGRDYAAYDYIIAEMDDAASNMEAKPSRCGIRCADCSPFMPRVRSPCAG